jgi:ribose/xylose/arabinose/galactoside ABC-type transport system permease subunit
MENSLLKPLRRDWADWWGLVTDVLILGVLGNGMQLIGMGTYAQYIVKGFVLLAAVGFDTYQKGGLLLRRPRAGAERAVR